MQSTKPGCKARSVDLVEAEAGVGLVGDRYHGSRHRHYTVQAYDELDLPPLTS